MEKFILTCCARHRRLQHIQRLIVLICAISLTWMPLPALAWSAAGHQTVAWIAQAQLTPAARAVIEHLLAQEPGSSLASISTWPDEHRDSNNTRWHYVNFPYRNCHYEAPRDCRDGQCAVAAIDAQMAILRSHASDAQKLEALKFVVHLVGDIHQPLHAGFGDDRGGNLYQIQFRERGGNLHALWDYEMVEQFHATPEQLARQILEQNRELVHALTPAKILGDTTPAWAEQSCRIVAEPNFYPGHRVSESYVEHYAPVVKHQLLRAGLRLGALLNTLG